MNQPHESSSPVWWRYVAYWYGGRLPVSVQDWVINDLTGPGAAVRMVTRWSIPCILLVLPMLFVPGPWGVRITMTMPILLSYLFFSIALNRVYRRYRLVQHGLDPELINTLERAKNADLYVEYHRKYRNETTRPSSVSR
ncbi:DUF5313 domain-containing protein [Gordonia sp. HS-NH1]|uniref:DUF5313 domain-containing protein n=1 Tax=Gordonia sp. HS-NH1 TaxID=1435068 RepID=UPI0006E19E30|nr:DUF5313 domain-containing protein [Gordonia sp. HS-NH1]